MTPALVRPQRKEAAERQRPAGEKGRGSPRTPSAAASSAAVGEPERLPVRPSESGLPRLRSVPGHRHPGQSQVTAVSPRSPQSVSPRSPPPWSVPGHRSQSQVTAVGQSQVTAVGQSQVTATQVSPRSPQSVRPRSPQSVLGQGGLRAPSPTPRSLVCNVSTRLLVCVRADAAVRPADGQNCPSTCLSLVPVTAGRCPSGPADPGPRVRPAVNTDWVGRRCADPDMSDPLSTLTGCDAGALILT